MTEPLAVLAAVRAALRARLLAREERRAVLAALVALSAAVRALSRGGLATAEQRLAQLPRLLPPRCSVAPGRLAVLISAVAKHVPGAECLAQSLVLAHLMREAGANGVVMRIGVRPGESALAAHAWVELDGVVVNDSDDVAERFPVIETRARS